MTVALKISSNNKGIILQTSAPVYDRRYKEKAQKRRRQSNVIALPASG